MKKQTTLVIIIILFCLLFALRMNNYKQKQFQRNSVPKLMGQVLK